MAEISKLGREILEASGGPADLRSPPLAMAPFDEITAKQHQAAWAKHLKVPVLWTNTIGMRFVLIPPGEFDMGSAAEEVPRLLEEAKAKNLPSWFIERVPSEAPKHCVRITRPFYLGISEVTQAEYERVMGSNPSKFKGDPTRPVEMVNWDEASAFCRKVGELPQEQTARAAYRLPTEAEWEYACRAGTTARHSFGDAAQALGANAWWSENSQGQTAPVGRLRPNVWGLCDMLGNVWEWCSDWHAGDYYAGSPSDDPTGPESGQSRVLRGGAWDSVYPGHLRSAYRPYAEPDARAPNYGFRVVKAVAP